MGKRILWAVWLTLHSFLGLDLCDCGLNRLVCRWLLSLIEKTAGIVYEEVVYIVVIVIDLANIRNRLCTFLDLFFFLSSYIINEFLLCGSFCLVLAFLIVFHLLTEISNQSLCIKVLLLLSIFIELLKFSDARPLAICNWLFQFLICSSWATFVLRRGTHTTFCFHLSQTASLRARRRIQRFCRNYAFTLNLAATDSHFVKIRVTRTFWRRFLAFGMLLLPFFALNVNRAGNLLFLLDFVLDLITFLRSGRHYALCRRLNDSLLWDGLRCRSWLL